MNRELMDQGLWADIAQSLGTTVMEGNPGIPPATERLPPMTTPEIPGVGPTPVNPLPNRRPTEDQRQKDEQVRKYGTFLTRELTAPGQNDRGRWWREQLIQESVVTKIQRDKRYDKIPSRPDAPSRLFSSEEDSEVPLQDGTSEPRKGYLGRMLREYIILLIRILDDQSQRIGSAVFRLRSASREQKEVAEKAVTNHIAECGFSRGCGGTSWLRCPSMAARTRSRLDGPTKP